MPPTPLAFPNSIQTLCQNNGEHKDTRNNKSGKTRVWTFTEEPMALLPNLWKYNWTPSLGKINDKKEGK